MKNPELQYRTRHAPALSEWIEAAPGCIGAVSDRLSVSEVA